jgi:hypothetical protein
MIKGSSIYIQQILHKLDSLLVILKNLATVVDPKTLESSGNVCTKQITSSQLELHQWILGNHNNLTSINFTMHDSGCKATEDLTQL